MAAALMQDRHQLTTRAQREHPPAGTSGRDNRRIGRTCSWAHRRRRRTADRQASRRAALGRVDRPGAFREYHDELHPRCGGAGGSSATARWATGAATWTGHSPP
jgi:hypothetical protein